MSDWHFGIDHDMWLYPPVNFYDPDYDGGLPEPIEAADIEGTILVNAEDATNQVRMLQAENAKLRELVLIAGAYCANGYCGEGDGCPLRIDGSRCKFSDHMRKLGIEVGDD